MKLLPDHYRVKTDLDNGTITVQCPRHRVLTSGKVDHDKMEADIDRGRLTLRWKDEEVTVCAQTVVERAVLNSLYDGASYVERVDETDHVVIGPTPTAVEQAIAILKATKPDEADSVKSEEPNGGGKEETKEEAEKRIMTEFEEATAAMEAASSKLIAANEAAEGKDGRSKEAKAAAQAKNEADAAADRLAKAEEALEQLDENS